MFKMSSACISALKDTSDQGLLHTFKGLGAVENGLTGIKNMCMESLHFQLQLNTLGFLSNPTDKNLQN
jgi:hypothetical protein